MRRLPGTARPRTTAVRSGWHESMLMRYAGEGMAFPKRDDRACSYVPLLFSSASIAIETALSKDRFPTSSTMSACS